MKTANHVFAVIILLTLIRHTISQIDNKVFEVDGQVIDLKWCGEDDTVVFAITDVNSLYRSENRGLSWTKMNEVLTYTAKGELEENDNHVLS